MTYRKCIARLVGLFLAPLWLGTAALMIMDLRWGDFAEGFASPATFAVMVVVWTNNKIGSAEKMLDLGVRAGRKQGEFANDLIHCPHNDTEE